MVEVVIMVEMVILVEIIIMGEDRQDRQKRQERQNRQDRQDRQDRNLNLTFQVICDWQFLQFLRCFYSSVGYLEAL